MERTESRGGSGVGLGTAVKGAAHVGESSGLETRGQEESQLQQDPEERERGKMEEKWSLGALIEKPDFVSAPSQAGKHFHPYFACVQISERPLLMANLSHFRRDSKILNIG